MWQDAFTAAELDRIEAYGDSLAKGMGHRAQHDAIRVIQAASITRNPDTAWLYQRMEDIVLRLNEQFFRYELYGLSENFEYAIYDSGSHRDWLKDHGNAQDATRKISLTLQLSDDDTYRGSDLQLHGDWLQAAPRKRGTLVAFPSFMLNRVTPIESGIRKALAVWAVGPEFR